MNYKKNDIGQYQICAFVKRDPFCPRLELFIGILHTSWASFKNTTAGQSVQDINLEEISKTKKGVLHNKR